MMIVITTKSSRMVNAPPARNEARMSNVEMSNAEEVVAVVVPHSGFVITSSLISRLLLQTADDADERHEQRDDNCADDEREEKDNDWSQHRGRCRHGVVGLFVINVGELQD